MKNTNERKLLLKAFLPMLAVFLLPIIAVVVFAIVLPPVYDGTFVGELSEKYDRLSGIDDPKIVIVGGSSAAFGIDSEMIEGELGRDVVNFGLYANLGTKLMMDLSKANINEGDIVILAPELNSQTLSLYFNQETAAQALDGSFYMLKNVDSDNYDSLIGAMWGLGSQKLKYHTTKTRPENAGAYKKENFNEYGDNVFDRPYNVLSGNGNPIVLNFITDYTDGITTDYEEYIDYVNDYVEYAEKQGASVYFSFPPMNAAVFSGYNSAESVEAFYKNLVRSLDCKVISNIYDYILDDGYFYDSEFHLNNSGVVVRTVRLIDDIKRELGIDSITVPATELPSPSGKRPDCEDFELRRLSNDYAWAIYAVSEAGAEKSYLTVPDEVNGIPVTTVSAGAFDRCGGVALLTLGKNVVKIESGAIENAENLVGVIIPEGAAAERLELPEDIGVGCADGFKVFVSPSEYDRYLSAQNLSAVRQLIVPDESFEYEIEGGRAVIVGLSESGKTRAELTVPAEYDGLPVSGIAEYAIDSVVLEKLILGENIKTIAERAFSLAPSGLGVYIPAGVSPKSLTLPNDPADLGGRGVRVFVDWTDYDGYLASEAFRSYGDTLTTDNPYLMLEKAEDGSWTVVGVNERGRGLDELTIPDEVSGAAVRTVAENAFSGTDIAELTLGKNISRLDGGAFRGSNLEKVILPDGIGAGDVSVPNNMSEALATDGCKAGLKILVDPTLYSQFVSDYFWGDYGGCLAAK